MEQQIRELCSKLLKTHDPNEAKVVGERLRSAIHQHIHRRHHGAQPEFLAQAVDAS